MRSAVAIHSIGETLAMVAIDRFGVRALLGGAAVLALIAVVSMLAARRPAAVKHFLADGS